MAYLTFQNNTFWWFWLCEQNNKQFYSGVRVGHYFVTCSNNILHILYSKAMILRSVNQISTQVIDLCFAQKGLPTTLSRLYFT